MGTYGWRQRHKHKDAVIGSERDKKDAMTVRNKDRV